MSEDKLKGNKKGNPLTEEDVRKLDFWNRDPIPKDERDIRMQVQEISETAIKSGSCLITRDEIEAFQTHLAGDGRDNFCEVAVLTVDIRKSSIALVNVEDFPEFNKVLTDFICYIKDTWRGRREKSNEQRGRFFDKFTGDGVLCFWVLPEEPPKHMATRKVRPKRKDQQPRMLIDHYYDMWNERIKEIVDFSIEMTCRFMQTFLPGIRRTCGLIKKDFGLSIGIDAGNCFLTELRSSIAKEAPKDWYKIQYGNINIADNEAKKLEEQRIIVSNNVTIMGRPVIGATRMVETGKPYEILVNCYPGAALKARIDDPKELKIREDLHFGLDLVYRGIKEYPYPDGVEAYRVNTDRIENLKRELGLVKEDEDTSKKSEKKPDDTTCKGSKKK